METIETPTNRGQITNPWDREHRAEYRMGTFERLMHDKLGFRTGYDTYMENMDNAAAAWAAQQENNAYEENYNSAAQQAARMREAGLNPDIDPSTVQPGQATEFSEPENMPESPAGQDMETLQYAGESAAKLGTFLLSLYSGGVAAIGTLTGSGIKLGEYLRDRDLKEDEEIRKMVEEAINVYGSLPQGEKEMGLTYANGSAIASWKKLSGKRYEKFARLYDDALSSLPAIAKRLSNENTVTEKKREAISTTRALNLEDKLWDIKDTMAEAEILIAQCKQEEARRKAEFLKNNPQFTREELEAGIMKAQLSQEENNAVMSKWRKIEAEAEATIAKINSDAITNYEKKWKTGIPQLEDYLRYGRAKERMGIHRKGLNVGYSQKKGPEIAWK